MYRQLKQTAFGMLASSAGETYYRIRGIITNAHTHRACSPGDVDASNVVGVVLKAALPTPKEVLRAAVGSLTMPTAGAGLRGVPRINRNYRDTSKCGLVLQHPAKQRVRPQVVLVPTGLATPRGALSKVRQVLNGDGVASRERVHDTARYGVKRVANEALLSAGEPVPSYIQLQSSVGVAFVASAT